MSQEIQLVIHGAGGRMGHRLIALGSQDPDFVLAGAVESAHHPRLGDDVGIVAGIEPLKTNLTSSFPENTQVIIDFSNPAGADRAVQYATEHKIPLVMATTGLSDATQAALQEAAKHQAICWAPNMSLAVNLTMKLAEVCAAALKNHPSGADVEIIERHHRFKEDAPSGTALKFGDLIAEKMGLAKASHGRQGMLGVKGQDEIGYHAVRVGDNPGEHTIVFGLLGETIELRVAASNRDCYAQGALIAAKFLVGKEPGLYSMYDVLGL
jgi:4-hydroxy-tetrahydrodipicolinate reductase